MYRNVLKKKGFARNFDYVRGWKETRVRGLETRAVLFLVGAFDKKCPTHTLTGLFLFCQTSEKSSPFILHFLV